MCKELKGLLVEIMGDDCTNNGVTSGKTTAILVGHDIDRVASPSGGKPVLKLFAGRGNREFIAVPYDTPEGTYPQFGGHFIHGGGDSRFPFPYPIHVHDRFETAQEYRSLLS